MNTRNNLSESGQIMLGVLIVLAVGAMIVGLALSLTSDKGLGVNVPSLNDAVTTVSQYVGQSQGGLTCTQYTYANGNTEVICR